AFALAGASTDGIWAGTTPHKRRRLRLGESGLGPKIESERFPVSLRLAGRLTICLDERPDPLHEEVGNRVRRIPDIDTDHLAVTRIPHDRGNQCRRRVGCVAQPRMPGLPLGAW